MNNSIQSYLSCSNILPAALLSSHFGGKEREKVVRNINWLPPPVKSFPVQLVSRLPQSIIGKVHSLYLLSQAGRLSEGLTSRVPHRADLLRSPEALKTNPIWGTMRRIYGKDKGEIYMKYPPLRYGRGAHKPGRTTLSHKIPLFSISTVCNSQKLSDDQVFVQRS